MAVKCVRSVRSKKVLRRGFEQHEGEEGVFERGGG